MVDSVDTQIEEQTVKIVVNAVAAMFTFLRVTGPRAPQLVRKLNARGGSAGRGCNLTVLCKTSIIKYLKFRWWLPEDSGRTVSSRDA